MKKLLLIVPCISYGGLENVAITTAHALRDQYDITLLYFYPSETEIPTDIPKVCLNIPYSLHLTGQLQVMLKRHLALRRYLKQHKPDICFSIGKTASISNLIARGKARCIASLHGYADVPHGKLAPFLLRMLFGRADKTICVSKALAQEFIAATGIAQEKIATCTNPFDIPDLIQRSNDTAAAPTLAGNPKLFAFGRVVEGKNFGMAIEAVSHLQQKYPEITLSLAGDGDFMPALQAQAEALGVSEHIHFLGMLANPFAALKQADILLNPSWNEGFGNTVVEAFLCGVPVIATDCKVGPRENIAPNSNLMKIATDIEWEEYGVLLPPSYPSDTPDQCSANAKRLATAADALWQNEALRKRYAEQGLARMEEYALPHYIATLTAILEG